MRRSIRNRHYQALDNRQGRDRHPGTNTGNPPIAKPFCMELTYKLPQRVDLSGPEEGDTSHRPGGWRELETTARRPQEAAVRGKRPETCVWGTPPLSFCQGTSLTTAV